MKKILSIMIIGSLLISCSKEETKCQCDLEVTIDGNGSYFVTGVPTDCNGNYQRPENVPQHHFLLGLRNCK